MTPRRQAVYVTLTAVAVGAFLVIVPTNRHFFDLGVYRGAVRYWLLDGGALYDFRYQGTQYGFTYPPFAALVFLPLLVLPWPAAILLSVLVDAAALGLLVRWFVVPVLRRNGWPVRTPCGYAAMALVMFEPIRDTFSFGQVNLALLVLVLADLRTLRAGHRWAGVGVGLAAAIKLTPAAFLAYLVVARRYRAAAVAAATAGTATLVAALVSPDASGEFWTGVLGDTGRIGDAADVSNQSLNGAVARLGLSRVWWLAAVTAVLLVWFLLARRADVVAGFALTGVAACLVSPITWVHHLVWLLPALLLLAGDALDRRDPGRLAALFLVYAALSSSVVFLWWAGPHGWPAEIGSNAYVWISIGLLAAVPTAAVHRAATDADGASTIAG